MIMIKNNFILLLAAVSISFVGFGQQKNLDTYFASNSLVNHLVQVNITPTQETSTPHWMYFLANEAGHTFTASGNFMSLIHARDPNYIPLENMWFSDFDSIPSGWDSFGTPSLGQSPIDNIVITPYNFVQPSQPSPTDTYGFMDTTLSPVIAIDTFVNYVRSESPDMPIYIYEGWNEMDAYTNGVFPPTPPQFTNWINSTRFGTTYHDWFIELHDSAVSNHPNDCVKMIPVGPIIAELLDRPPYNTMVADSIFEDTAPHGRPSIYFLAGMISYMAIYEEPAPLSYVPPSEFIDPVIVSNYQNLVHEIWTELLAFNFDNGTSRVFCNPPASSIKKKEPLYAFKVFPNPSNTVLNIQTDLPEGKLQLRDIRGNVVSETSIHTPIDVQQFARGYYFLELYDLQNQSMGIQKVIIQ